MKRRRLNVTIPAGGREYVKWTVDGLPEDVGIEATFDGETWHPTMREGGEAWLLVASPDAVGEGAVVLEPGGHDARLRATDSPEIVSRPAGTVHILR